METPLSISSSELQALQSNEACIIQEFTVGFGTRIGKLAAVGTREEMEEEVKRTSIIAVPLEMKFECQTVLNCSELLRA
jgi:hypothetical protein